jgi:tetratricopeptide (TPR) repeat protein
VEDLRRDYVAQSYLRQALELVSESEREHSRAVALARRAESLSPQSSTVRRAALDVFLAAREWDSARETLDALEETHGGGEVYLRGMVSIYTGEEQQGRALLESYLDSQHGLWQAGRLSDFGYALALNNVGYFMADQGVALDAALVYTQQAVRMAPLEPSFIDSLGWAYYRRDDYDRAAFYLERALRLEAQKSSEVYYHAGTVHARRRQRALAWQELKQAVNLRGGYYPAAEEELNKLRMEVPIPIAG